MEINCFLLIEKKHTGRLLVEREGVVPSWAKMVHEMEILQIGHNAEDKAPFQDQTDHHMDINGDNEESCQTEMTLDIFATPNLKSKIYFKVR